MFLKIALTLLLQTAAVPSGVSPMETIQEYFKVLAKGDPNSNQFIDFAGLGQDCVENKWKQFTPKQKTEYIDIFTQLLQAQHLRKARVVKDPSKIQCKPGQSDASEAKIHCILPRPDLDSDAEYLLKKTGDRWLIRNMVIDQVDLRKNYETMFRRDFQFFSIDEMIEKMRLKLASPSKESK